MNDSLENYICYRMARRIRKAKSEKLDNSNGKRARVPVTYRNRSQELKGEIKKGISKKARKTIEEEIFKACIAEGMSREQIAKTLGIHVSNLASIEKRILTGDGQRYISKSTAYRYYEYALQQEQNIRDLDYFVDMIYEDAERYRRGCRLLEESEYDEDIKVPPKPSVQAAVLAIKAKSDIHDRTIRMGQELGIVEKRAKEIRVSGNVNLAALDTEELRVMLSKKLKAMDALVQKGEVPSVFNNILRSRNAKRLESRSDEPEHYVDAEYTEEVPRSVD